MSNRPVKFILALLLFAISCAGVAAADSKKPQVVLKGLTVNGVDLQQKTADTTISVEIQNPGSSFKVRDVSYRLKLNGKHLAEGKYKDEIKVPGESSAVIDLPLKVSLQEIPGLTWSTVAGGFAVHYDLETTFTVPVMSVFNRKMATSFSGEFVFGQMLSGLPQAIRERLFGKL
ncbi:MAG TPA: LEA type 2 family protein [Blastocatellia bacterium]|jgi:LEA14-like dessication related protein|nr:LEA type 2 family protein [Blastocatellia bacterium]